MPFDAPLFDANQAVNMNRLGMADYTNEQNQIKANQDRQTLQNAGAALAQGDYKGGAAAAFQGGNLDVGLQIQKALQAKQDHELAGLQRQQASLGNVALLADTPDKWTQAVQAYKATGAKLPQGAEDFGYRTTALANAGMANDAINTELKRRAAGKSDLVSVAPGNSLVSTATGQPVYTAPPRTAGGLQLPPGVDVKMADKAIEATDSADNILDAVHALRDVAGVKQADGTYALHPDVAATVGPEPSLGGWYRTAKANVGITGAAGAAQRLDQAKQTVVSLVTGLYNKGQGAISDSERRMYEKLLGDIGNSVDQKTVFGLIDQLDNLTQSVRNRSAARRPIGLADNTLTGRENIPVPIGGGKSQIGDNTPTVGTPEEAAKLPIGTTFKTPDGQIRVRH